MCNVSMVILKFPFASSMNQIHAGHFIWKDSPHLTYLLFDYLNEGRLTTRSQHKMLYKYSNTILNLESHAANTAVKFQIDNTISTPIVVSEVDFKAANYSFIW